MPINQLRTMNLYLNFKTCLVLLLSTSILIPAAFAGGATVTYSVMKPSAYDPIVWVMEPKRFEIEPSVQISIPAPKLNRTCTFKKSGFSQGQGITIVQYELNCSNRSDNVNMMLTCSDSLPYKPLPKTLNFDYQGNRHLFTVSCE